MRRATIGAALFGLLVVGTVSMGQLPAPTVEVLPDKGGWDAGDLHVCAGGLELNVLEARLGGNLHRETLPDWVDLPRCSRLLVAPPSTAGSFAIQYEKSKERFIVAGWSKTSISGQPRRLISVSPASDEKTLGVFRDNPKPIVLCWLSPVALRIAQYDFSIPGDDKLRVRVILFDPEKPAWYQTWPGVPESQPVIELKPRNWPRTPPAIPQGSNSQ